MVNATSEKVKRQTGLLCAVALLLAGCDMAGRQSPPCPLPGQVRTISLKLYFGRDIPGGGFVTDAAFAEFAADVLTPAFPDGLTAYEALGQWRNPGNGQIVREKSFVIETVGPPSSATIAKVIATYQTQFHQISVGQVSQDVCAAF